MSNERPVCIGTDCGATTSKIGGVWQDGTIISTKLLQRATPAEAGPAAVVSAWVDAVDAFLQQNGLTWQQVRGVGLAIPGPFQRYGVLDKSANLPASFTGFDVHTAYAAALANKAGRAIPVVVGNDGNLGGVGEARQVRGAGRGTVLMLAPGSGLGAAFIDDRGLSLDGDNLAGMEGGHMPAPLHLLGAYGSSFYAVLRSSDGQLLIRGGSGDDVVTVSVFNSILFVSVDIGNDVPGTGRLPGAGNLPAFTAYFPTLSAIHSIVIQTGAGYDTIRIGTGSINLMPQVSVDGGAGTNSLYVDDSSVTNPYTYTVTSSTVTRNAAFGGLTYVNAANLTLYAEATKFARSLTTVNVQSTTKGTPVTIAGYGSAEVNVGNNGGLQSVQGDLTINPSGSVALSVNGSADLGGQITITDSRITGLAPAKINYRKNGLSSLTIGAGYLGAVVTVANTPTAPVTLNMGVDRDTVNVLATAGPLTVNGQSGLDIVNIGSNGSVRQIGGALTVTNARSYSAVTVDDSADTSARTVILYNNGAYNVLNGFPTGGVFLFKGGQLRSLVISAGSKVVGGVVVGGNTFRIHDTPTSTVPGGVTTTVNTGAGPDNVTVDGTTGTLALNDQGASPGANVISVGSATANLDGIYGPINITGAAGAESDLSIIDSASITSHQYVIDRNFVQRGGRARIGYQNMSQLTVRTAAQPDHIIVQDTAPFAIGHSTSIPLSGGNDVIDVLKTTGTLLIDAGGTSAINVGSAASSLDNIQGGISLAPQGAGNQVMLSLDDEAATTTQQLDITPQLLGFVGRSFQRSGAALINELFSPLYSFQWHSGSGGTDVHEYVMAAQLTNFILGNDVLTIGTRAGAVSDFGPITVTGGVGPDAVILNDSAEARPQTYTVSQGAGHEILTTRGTTVDLGFDIESFEVKGSTGGNIFNVNGTIAGLTTILHVGTGVNTVNAGGPADSLQAIAGPVTLDGTAGTNTLVFDDQGTTTLENYTLAVDQLRRVEATGVVDDMAPISLAGFQAVTLNVSSGGSAVGVYGSRAGGTVTVNGHAGSVDDFAVDASTNAILAVAPNGAIYSANAFLAGFPNVPGGIIQTDPVTGTQTTITAGGLLNSATDVLVEPNGDLTALDLGNGIVRVDPTTGTQSSISDFTNPDQGPTVPYAYGLAREAAGTYLATDYSNNQVLRIDPETGERTVVSSGGDLDGPYGIAVEANGDILVRFVSESWPFSGSCAASAAVSKRGYWLHWRTRRATEKSLVRRATSNRSKAITGCDQCATRFDTFTHHGV